MGNVGCTHLVVIHGDGDVSSSKINYVWTLNSSGHTMKNPLIPKSIIFGPAFFVMTSENRCLVVMKRFHFVCGDRNDISVVVVRTVVINFCRRDSMNVRGLVHCRGF